MTEQPPDGQIQSEQQERLELKDEPMPYDDPPEWANNDPDQVRNTGGEAGLQFSPPGGGGEPEDREPDEVAEDGGTSYPTGPEHQAVRVEERG